MFRLLRIIGYAFSLVGALLLIAWAIRGARPALECGVIEAARALDWPAAYACLDKADYDPLREFAILTAGILALLAARFTPDSNSKVYDPTPEERAHNRAVLANRVQKTWIDGELKQRLTEAVLIALGWQPSPESVEMHPWSMKVGKPDENGTLVPPNKGIAALFDQSEGALLILGEPGAGKTTMLLSLTQELLNRQKAENAHHPIPIVFNLSSWKGNEPSLDDWLVNALDFYGVGETVARFLVEHGELALMLDGLDEVREEMRNECVAAINAYRKEHLVPVALCCRVAAYQELNSKLVAQLAVTLQPLTPEQQDGYLDELMLPEAGRLKAALHADAALREVAESPLMLSVMLGAGDYLRLDNAELTQDALRSAIWDAYLQNMLNRERKTKAHYPAQQVVRQLSWLAKKMVQRSLSVFLVERLSSDWANPIFGLSFQAIWRIFLQVAAFLLFGLLYGPIIGMIASIILGIYLRSQKQRYEIDIREKVSLDFRPKLMAHRLLLGLTIGLLAGIVLGEVIAPFRGAEIALKIGLSVGVASGLTIGLIWGLLIGLLSQSTALEDKRSNMKPNVGVIKVLRNSIIVGILAGVTGGFLWGLGYKFALPYDVPGFSFAPAIVLAVMAAGLVGLYDVVAHYVLRVVLWLNGSTPLNYVCFLDYCADRILLRKVGGGYIFIHRTFMEHMAAIDPTKFDFDTPAGKSKV